MNRNIFYCNNFIYLIFIAIGLFALTNCNKNKLEAPENTDWKSEESSSKLVSKEINYLRMNIKRQYSTNPDSAIYYYDRIIDLYHKEQMSYNEFDANLKLSELYSFRKGEAVKAISYYNKALKIMIMHEKFENENPYFHIDMGNMFYANKLFPQAKKSYLRAIRIARKQNNNFAISVGQNNIGILFRASGEYDSACVYFHKALVIRKKIIPLYEAQNYLYLAKVFAFKGLPDSILLYRSLGLEAMKRQASTTIDTTIITVSASKALTQDMYVYDANIMAIYYKDIQNYSKSIYYYKLTWQRSKELKDDMTTISCLLEISKLYVLIHDIKHAIKYAESTYQMALEIRSQDYVVNSTRLLSQLYDKTNNIAKANYYLTQNLNFTDSLDKSLVSVQKEADEILLITAQAEESLRSYLYKERDEGKIIKSQFFWIITEFILLIVLCLLVIYIYQKKRKLKIEHLKQVNMILRGLEKEEKNKGMKLSTDQIETVNKMENQLVILFDDEKIYTQKNLSLSDVARMLGTNITYLSQYINNNLNTTYNDYVNSYRIKDACRIFQNNTSLKYSIDQVSDMVGFGSRTTFYSTFKKMTGVTPAFFQKNVMTKEQLLDIDLNDMHGHSKVDAKLY